METIYPNKDRTMNDPAGSPRKLTRSIDDRVFFGVCGGIAEQLNWPPWAVRILFIVLQFSGIFSFMFLVYLALALALPKKSVTPSVIPGSAEDTFWRECGGSRSEALRRLSTRFESLDKRLQRMESIVTRPGFDIEEEFRKL